MPIVELPSQEKLNNFEIVISVQILESLIEPANISVKLSAKILEPEKPANASRNYNKILEQDILLKQSAIIPKTPAINLYNLQKYNYNQENKPDKPNKKITKQARAILALLEQEEFNLANQKAVFIIATKDQDNIQIPISKFYSKAATDPIYKPE